MPSPQMLQTLSVTVKRGEIPTGNTRTFDVIFVEAVLGPVGKAAEVLRTGLGVALVVVGKVVTGAELEEAEGALVDLRADYGRGER